MSEMLNATSVVTLEVKDGMLSEDIARFITEKIQKGSTVSFTTSTNENLQETTTLMKFTHKVDLPAKRQHIDPSAR